MPTAIGRLTNSGILRPDRVRRVAQHRVIAAGKSVMNQVLKQGVGVGDVTLDVIFGEKMKQSSRQVIQAGRGVGVGDRA